MESKYSWITNENIEFFNSAKKLIFAILIHSAGDIYIQYAPTFNIRNKCCLIIITFNIFKRDVPESSVSKAS